MTHITEPRVIGNHADMGPSPTTAPEKRRSGVALVPPAEPALDSDAVGV
ncbi:hypothetical protein ABQF34_30055 [Mycolicibacterium boenickei]